MTVSKWQMARDGLAIVQLALIAGLVMQPTEDIAKVPLETTGSTPHTQVTNDQNLATGDTRALSNLIQQTIRQEVKALPGTYQPNSSATPAARVVAVEEVPVDKGGEYQKQEAILAYQNSNDIIETALLTGHWSDDDNRELFTEMAVLSADQRFQLMDKFLTAVNAQELTLNEFPQF